jgi:hypothetical protein
MVQFQKILTFSLNPLTNILKAKVLFLRPDFTQLNISYPLTVQLKGFLKTTGKFPHQTAKQINPL